MDETTTHFPWERTDDTIVFETPEQTRIELRLAPFGTRIVAAMLDRVVIILITLLVVLLVFLTAISGLPGEDGTMMLLTIGLVFQFLFSLFYFAWGEVRWEGQTFGKRRFKIRTMMITGQGVTLGAAIVRNLARVLDEFPLLWVVPSMTRGKRRSGDLLAGTVVVMVTEREESDALNRWRLATSYPDLADRHFYFSSDVAQRLFADDLNLLEHLGQQVEGVPYSERRRILRLVADRYIDRLELQDQEPLVRENPTRFLQELTLFLENHFDDQAY